MQGDAGGLPASSSDARGPQVGYFADVSRPLLAIVRSVGVLAIVMSLVSLILWFFAIVSGQATAAPPDARDKTLFYSLNQVVSICVSLILDIWMLIAGAGFLRREPRGRHALVLWAWTMIAWAVYGISIGCWYLMASRGRYSASALVYSFMYYLHHWTVNLVFPFIVLVLMRQRAIRELFERDALGECESAR
jgi:hypothetical protein